jgi:CheY-like chemotaxis protein
MSSRAIHCQWEMTTLSEHARRRTVLIVDDDDDIRYSMRNLLVVSNFNVVLAADGVEALKVLERQQVDALIVDLMMPRLDGVGVARALLTMPPDQRPAVVIVVSAHVELHTRLMGLSVRRVLSKPFDAFALVEELRAAFDELERPADEGDEGDEWSASTNPQGLPS